MHPGVVELTANVPSTTASCERKKNCTARAACASVRLSGSDGLSDGPPGTVALNVRALSSTSIVLSIDAPDDGRSGVL